MAIASVARADEVHEIWSDFQPSLPQTLTHGYSDIHARIIHRAKQSGGNRIIVCWSVFSKGTSGTASNSGIFVVQSQNQFRDSRAANVAQGNGGLPTDKWVFVIHFLFQNWNGAACIRPNQAQSARGADNREL